MIGLKTAAEQASVPQRSEHHAALPAQNARPSVMSTELAGQYAHVIGQQTLLAAPAELVGCCQTDL